MGNLGRKQTVTAHARRGTGVDLKFPAEQKFSIQSLA